METLSVVDLIKEGKLEGFNEAPEMVVTTISNIFIFREAGKVLKMYRRDNEYWNTSFSDLSGGETRSQFIREDFAANRAVNPTVYLDLQKVQVEGEKITLTSPQETDDELVIVMSYVNAKESFNDKLFQGSVSENDFTSMGTQFAKIKKHISVPEERTKENWFELMLQRIPDLEVWMKHLNQHIPSDVTQRCIETLTRYKDENKEYFSSIKGDDLVYTIDAHGENALFNEGKLEFIDILLPAARWRWTPKEYDIYCLGTDVYVLAGEEAFEKYIEGAKKEYANFEEKDRDFYLLYCAGLMVCILATLVQSKPEKEPLMKKYYEGFIELLERAKSGI